MPQDGRPCPTARARDWPRLVLDTTCCTCGRRAHIPVGVALGCRWCGPDTRRLPNGTLHGAVTGAAPGHPTSRVWAGYWQR